MLVAEGFAVHRSRPADGRVRLHACDVGPLDVAHGWAITAGVEVSRGKREARDPKHRDQHVLAFARDEDLLEVAHPLGDAKEVPQS
ncbi:hypothetical protein K7G98_38430, partial [Saccharothrix sp. MB29]|nr:hypothetical protein [Saccharothrix sp. MB29]